MTVLRRLVPVLAVSGLLVLAACSDGADTLDQAATERAVGKAVAAKVDPKVTATTCPDPIEREEDGRFTCTVTLQGAGDLPVSVTQTDEDGTLRVVPGAAVVTQERVTSELKAALKEQFGRSFQVACDLDDDVAVRAPGSTATCTARDATSRRTVAVTVTDTAGTLSFDVGDASG